MRTDDTLLLQALKLKQLGDVGISSGVDLIEQADPDLLKTKMRNICAFVSNELFDDVAQVCGILSISKRQMVEMALIDVMEKAHKIINETEALKSFEVN